MSGGTYVSEAWAWHPVKAGGTSVVPVAAICTTYSVAPAMQCLPGQVSMQIHGITSEKYGHGCPMKVTL